MLYALARTNIFNNQCLTLNRQIRSMTSRGIASVCLALMPSRTDIRPRRQWAHRGFSRTGNTARHTYCRARGACAHAGEQLGPLDTVLCTCCFNIQHSHTQVAIVAQRLSNHALKARFLEERLPIEIRNRSFLTGRGGRSRRRGARRLLPAYRAAASAERGRHNRPARVRRPRPARKERNGSYSASSRRLGYSTL